MILSVGGEADAATGVRGGEARSVSLAARRACPARPVDPRSAAQHALRAGLRAQWIDHVALGILAVPVAAPLPDVAVHVKEAPRIGREGTDRRRRLAINALLPSVIGPIAVVVGLVGRDGRA